MDCSNINIAEPEGGCICPECMGSRLRKAREYLGLSQEFVATQIGIPRQAVYLMESGKRGVVRFAEFLCYQRGGPREEPEPGDVLAAGNRA